MSKLATLPSSATKLIWLTPFIKSCDYLAVKPLPCSKNSGGLVAFVETANVFRFSVGMLAAPFYDRRASVGKQMAHALDVVPRDRLLVIELGTLHSDKDKVWAELCDFFRSEVLDDIDFTAQNLRKVVRFPILLQLSAVAFQIKCMLSIRGGLRIVKTIKSVAVPVAKDRDALDPAARQSR
jgi:hypothetical protein